jgi:L-rhamnose mutarotase
MSKALYLRLKLGLLNEYKNKYYNISEYMQAMMTKTAYVNYSICDLENISFICVEVEY